MSLGSSRTAVLSLALLILTLPVNAVRIQGLARDAFTRLPISGVDVVVERDDVRTGRYATRLDGFYRFDVPVGSTYRIRFERKERVSRFVIIDLREVPREWTDALWMELDMRMFPPLEGMDSTLANAPAGTATWDATNELIVWDMANSGPLVERWNALLGQHAERHPEVRPSMLQGWAARGFDLARGNGAMLSFLILGLLYIAWRAIPGRSRRPVRIISLILVLIVSVGTVIELAHDPGPLRYVAFSALMAGVVAAFHMVMEHWVGGPTAVDEAEGDLDEWEAPEAQMDLPVTPSRSRWKEGLPLVIFFVAVGSLVLEGRWGLENTLNVWPLAGWSVLAGLSLAGGIGWMRTPALLRGVPGLVFRNGGVWWMALPMLMIAAASHINRTFPKEGVTCKTWPVVELNRTRRGINVHISLDGERERIELPRSIKEQLTTMDSLRCCTRTGFFGFDHVDHVEPVITPDDRP